MNKINFTLQMRLKSIKNKAESYAKHNPEGAYKAALDHQVKYGRKGWIKYDSANHYSAAGDLCEDNLDKFDAAPIQDISRRAFNYSGYYCDSFEHEIIRPYVVKIKTSRGFFICPAVDYSQSDIATIYLSDGILMEKGGDIEDCQFQIANIADSIAQKIADECRNLDAQFQAEQEAENLKNDNKKALQDARALISAIREQKTIGAIVGPICEALISDIKGLRAEIRRNNARIQELNDNYWLSVS